MPNTELLTAFILATAVFAYMPGPATLYTAAQTITKGRRGGFFAALGLHIGGYVHVMAAALGLGALFASLPLLYTGFKLAGAAYLIWLGVQMFLRKALADTSASDALTDAKSKPAKSTSKTLWESVTVEILNPKTALFYVAFLPQFTDTSAALPLWGQLLVLGIVVNVLFSSADIVCVFLAERISSVLRNSSSAKGIANKIGGGILIGLGVHLMVSR